MFAKCPECGMVGDCSLTIIPGPELTHDHVYSFKCSCCGEVIEKFRYAGSLVGDNPVTACPFCGCSNTEHSFGDGELEAQGDISESDDFDKADNSEDWRG